MSRRNTKPPRQSSAPAGETTGGDTSAIQLFFHELPPSIAWPDKSATGRAEARPMTGSASSR